MEKIHNNIWCTTYWAKVLPNEQGNCSLCDAKLANLTQSEAEQLTTMFEDEAIERTLQDNWDAREWMDADEKTAYEEIYKTAFQSE